MTTNQHRSFLAFALVLFTALSSCTVPTTGVTTPGSAKVTLQAHQARLVFQVGQARSLSRALTDAGYLTVELRSVADGTVKADDAVREADGSYLVDIDGLVAGDWKLKVRLYADINSTSLLYYADVVHYVAVGTPTAIALKVYEPSSLTGGTITLADKVEYLEVEGRAVLWGTSLNPAEPTPTQTLIPGETVQLHALPMSVPYDEDINPAYDLDSVKNPVFDEMWYPTLDGDTLDEPLFDDETYFAAWDENTDQGLLARPATDDRVTFTSDDPGVVEVTVTGRLKARGVGETTIHVTTVEGRKTASIPVKVEEAIVGVWESGSPRSSLLVVQRSLAGLEARLLVGLTPGATPLDHKRGLVTRLPDGSFQAVLPQNLQPNAARTALVWGQNTNNTEFYSLYPLPDGKLAVTDGDQMTFSRVANYLPATSLVHNPVTPASFTVLGYQDWSVPGSPWDIQNASSGAPTVSSLYWWVQNSTIGAVDPLTGVIQIVGFGATTIRAASVDNPELGQLAWSLSAEPLAPALALADLAVEVPTGYVTDVPSGDLHVLNLRIRVAYDPAVYRYLLIQRWNSTNSTWQDLNGGTDLVGSTVGTWFDNYVSVTPGTQEKFRVITKASTTTGITNDSLPSPEIVAMAPDALGNPMLWPGTNVVPGNYGTSGTFEGTNVPSFINGGDTYFSRWFILTDGTTWNPSLMYSLRYGTKTWWIYSDPVGASPVGTFIVGRDDDGNLVAPGIWKPGLNKVYNIGNVQANGDVNLFGAGSTSATLYWNGSTKSYQANGL